MYVNFLVLPIKLNYYIGNILMITVRNMFTLVHLDFGLINLLEAI